MWYQQNLRPRIARVPRTDVIENKEVPGRNINITQSWFDATDNNKTNGQKGVHALFIDFKKAFDMVDHKTLLMKLAEHHINKSFWQWIKSFLSQRTQQVKIQNILSTYSSCPAGVPQGSVISPVLFNVIINDLEDAVPNHLPISTNKYADDCTQHELISLNSQGNMQERKLRICGYASQTRSQNHLLFSVERKQSKELRLLNYWEYGSRTISNGIHTFIRLLAKPVKSYSTRMP